ncbi:response regulator transcription factor [Paenibacillus xylaniclasticus]|uniref:response regulator transcription factor n=1 Tax=Paenibacillus xylaniclasticus TaxID=588083 RepID=UPI000FD6EB74|nr:MULTISPECIES: response regulator transcription factor [Paenibacillus]GFN33469.1 DNA-binding response regulator [Paenibacillus curdlanolyticus]
MPYNLLLIEDDRQIVEMLQSYLTKEGYEVAVAMNGLDGIDAFKQHRFDLVIVDIMMPRLDGIEVIKQIRQGSSVPVIVMSAKDSDVDKAIGLGFGADDYIAKPFSLIELSARIKAAIRRATTYSYSSSHPDRQFNTASSIHTFGALRIDLDNFSASMNGVDLKLTAKEFDILMLFVLNPNRVFTKAQLFGFIWNEEYYGDENVINVHIRRLREKIEIDPSKPQLIKTLWGIGYRWEGAAP